MVEIMLFADAPAQSVNLKPGETLVIWVEDISTTGYQWHIDPLGSSVVIYQGSSLVPGVAPGAGGTRSFMFEAIGRGRTQIRLYLRRAWEDERTPLRQGTVDVNVEP